MSNDGGPAFPRPFSMNESDHHTSAYKPAQEGMTLRDYFAAKALAGLMACPEIPQNEILTGETHLEHDTRIAKWSYTLADAMLKARQA